jgi:DNA-binding beta-propeller fold protein YncE
VAFDKRGVFLFVALETSREVAVINAHAGVEMFRVDVGRAPQGLAVSSDGTRLYVSNFMDRTVTAFDINPLVVNGTPFDAPLATGSTVATESL